MSVKRQSSWFENVAERRDDEDARTGKEIYGVKWVADADANGCNVCSFAFTKIHRRHHCRCCGHLVCGGCSSARVVLSDDKKPSRVCDNCLMSERLGGKVEAAAASVAAKLAAIEEEKAAKAAEAARIQEEKDAIKAEAAAVKAAAAEEKAKIKEAANAEKAKIKEEKAAEKAKAKEEKAAEKAKAKEEKTAAKEKAKADKIAAKEKAKADKEAEKAKAKEEKEAAKADGGCPNCG